MTGPSSKRYVGTITVGLLCAALVSLLPTETLADIYAYIDKAGVTHFTNMPKRSRLRRRKKWRRIMRTGPGKAKSLHARRARKLSRKRRHAYDREIEEAATTYQIPNDLIRAVIRIESDFDSRAISSAGARGMMQLLPKTGLDMGASDLFHPRQNILAGTRYLRYLANRYEGDLVLTLAGYHAGPAAVRKYGGIPPFQTTRRYIKLVLDKYEAYRKVATVLNTGSVSQTRSAENL